MRDTLALYNVLVFKNAARILYLMWSSPRSWEVGRASLIISTWYRRKLSSCPSTGRAISFLSPRLSWEDPAGTNVRMPGFRLSCQSIYFILVSSFVILKDSEWKTLFSDLACWVSWESLKESREQWPGSSVLVCHRWLCLAPLSLRCDGLNSPVSQCERSKGPRVEWNFRHPRQAVNQCVVFKEKSTVQLHDLLTTYYRNKRIPEL